MIKYQRRDVTNQIYSEKIRLRNQKNKALTLLCILLITSILYGLFSDYIVSTAHSVYPRRNNELCIQCNIHSKEYQGVYDDDTISILFFTMFLNISKIQKSACCDVEQKVFDSTRYSNILLDKEHDYQTRLEYIIRIIKPYHVVLFHVRDMPGARLLKEVNLSRPRDQLWAYYNKESPVNTLNIVNGRYDDLFNIAITPLRDSDIFAPYGSYKKKVHTPITKWYNPKNADVIYNKRATYLDMKTRLIEQNKLLRMNVSFEEKHLIAWVVSNCEGVRTKYVLTLKHYLPIHIYGHCNTKFNIKQTPCKKNTFECEEQLRKYKFILAFENSFCDDYVTEKYWNTLIRGSVPIVLGGRNYDDAVVIPGSFINARSFNNAESLAKHIKFLGENKIEYEKYQRWRDDYVIDFTPNNHHNLEDVVIKIHKLLLVNSFTRKGYKLSKYYSARRNCKLHINDTLWETSIVT